MVLCKKPPRGGFFIWSITERSESYDRGGPWRSRPDDDLSASCLAIAGAENKKPDQPWPDQVVQDHVLLSPPRRQITGCA